MTENNYLVRDYEEKVNGRILCKQHGLLRCSDCAYIDDLEKENNRYREKFEAIQDIQQWHRKEPDYEVLNIVNEALEESE